MEGADPVALTARFVVTYSGAAELNDATLNISPPPGFSAYPSSVILPPVQGTGNGSGNGGHGGGAGGEGSPTDPLVIPVMFRAECGTGCIPPTLLGDASVVYTRPGTADGGNDPMSTRCDVQLPLAMAARIVDVSAAKGGAHKFTFNTNEPPLRLNELFEDMVSQHATGDAAVSDARLGGLVVTSGAGGGPAGAGSSGEDGGRRFRICDGGGEDLVSSSCGGGGDSATLSFQYWADDGGQDGESQNVSVAASKNSGRYRIQSGSFAALCVMATELVRRLKEHFGEASPGGRNKKSAKRATGDEEKLGRDAGERHIFGRVFALSLRTFCTCSLFPRAIVWGVFWRAP